MSRVRAVRTRNGRAVLRVCALVLALACASCARGPNETDQAGQSVSRGPRVVSLAPSLTEIAYAIGCGHSLVADTTYDDYPAPARHLPHVADLVDVDLERLTALRPTIVVALHDQEREVAAIQSRLRVPVMLLPNRMLADLYDDIAGVGRACGREAEAVRLARSLHAQIAAVVRTVPTGPRPRVFFLLDMPGFTAGGQSFIDELITLAGGTNTAGSIRQPYPVVGAEALLAMDPQVLIVAHDVHLDPRTMEAQPWRSLTAVREGRVMRPPSDDIVERNGPRVVQGLRWLVVALHPH